MIDSLVGGSGRDYIRESHFNLCEFRRIPRCRPSLPIIPQVTPRDFVLGNITMLKLRLRMSGMNYITNNCEHGFDAYN